MKRKRFLPILLIITLLFTMLPGMGTLTAVEGATVQGNDTVLQGKKIETVYGSALNGSDGKAYYEGVITAVHFQAGGKYTTKKTSSFRCKEMIGIDESGNQSWLYCVEKDTGFSRNGYSSTNLNNSSYLKMDRTGTLAAGLNKLASDKGISGLNGIRSIEYILTATIYGWQPDATMPAELSAQGLNDWDWFFGTQVVIWEFQQGIRQTPTQCNGNGFNDGDALYSWVEGRPAEYAYNYVLKMMAQHRTIPSFSTDSYINPPTYTLKWNSTNKRYETTLTDAAGYAFDLEFEDSDIKCVKSGNKYTIYTTKTITSPVLSTTQKEMHISANQELLVWGKSGKQTMISGMQDPVMFYLKLKTDKPTITIEKTGTTAADIANKVFYVYKDNASTACLTLTTDSSGYASGSLPGEGAYRVVEQNASKYNVTYSVQNFTYPSSAFDANNNITINVDNEQKVGYLQLKKESEDGIVEGLRFQVKNNSSGETATGTTDANGVLEFALVPGTYTVTEIDTPDRYEQPAAITVNITAAQTVVKTVKNVLRPSSLKIVKTSEDNVIAGVQFRITGTSATGKTVDKTVFTDSNGIAVVEMEQGTYTVSEINVPGKYYIPSSQKVTLNDGSEKILFFTNQLKPSYLQILKTSEDGIVRGFKFRVQGAERIMFSEKAYWYDACAVVDSSASVEEVFEELELDPSQYYVLNNNTGEQAALDDNISVGFVYQYGASLGSGYYDAGSIYNQDGSVYATMVIRGHYLNTPYSSVGTRVNGTDISGVKSCLGTSVNGPMYIAYDVDRDGVITQKDIDAMTVAYNNGTCVTAIEMPTVDVIGYTNSDGYVVFGEKAYLAEVAGTYNADCFKYAVVDKTATVSQILSDLGLDEDQYYIAASYSSSPLDSSSVVALSDSAGFSITFGSYRYIFNTADESPYAQIVFRGSVYYGNAASSSSSSYGVTDYDLTYASQRIGQSVADAVYPESLYLAAYDIDRDGVLTQDDYDVLVKANANNANIVGSTTLTVTAGEYHITELDVPDRYTFGFDQIITIAGEETKVVRVTNYLKTSGVKIVKKAEDGVIAGVQFLIEGTTSTGTTVSMSVTTDENGEITQKLSYGTYTITELNVPDRYLAVASQTVTLSSQDYVTVTFENNLKWGYLLIGKESEDIGYHSGISFRVQSIETLTGDIVDEIVTTGTNGTAGIYLIPGTYVITELDVADRYIVPEPQIVTITGGITTYCFVTNYLKVPTLEIVKTSEDGIIEGVQFEVTGTTLTGAEYSEVFTTDENGLISTQIPQGTYTVTEIQDGKYVTLAPQTVTLVNDETTSVVFHNVLKTGRILIGKQSEDGVVAGIQFHITGIGDDGIEVDMIVTTNTSGGAGADLKPGTYTIRELLDDEKYILQEPQEVTVVYDQTVTVTFTNILKKFQLTLTKKDGSTELGLPQGDGTMAGAVYGLYQEDGALIAEYTTDENGQFTTEEFPCEATYIQEIAAPKGYLLDETQYWLESSLADCYLEVTNLTLEVTDYPITGSISILKKMGTEEKWEYEPGAVFQVYLKSAGSYDAANEWERDLIVTDEATAADDNNLGEATTGGEAGTKDLPLGTYVVHQVSGTDGFHLIEDIEVTLTEENPTIRLELLNLSQVEMPNTGGSGTLPYVIGGILCMVVACSVAIMKMRNCKN